MVKFEPSLSEEQRKQILEAIDASLLSEIPELGVSVLGVPFGQAETAAANLNAYSGVIYAEPNYPVSATDLIPNDPGWSLQYNMVAIHAPQGWGWTTGSTSVTIAILDTGVDLSHPDLVAKILPGYDFVNSDPIAQDDNGHGTHVAAIAAASTNNGIGVAGVDGGAKILPVKVLDAAGHGTYANVAAGITWASDHAAQVINMSLGGAFPSSVLEDAVNYADAHGVILVAAAGNSGVGSILYPAAYPPVIAVAATDSSNQRASSSNYGPQVDVAAPGISIYSALPGGSYGYRSGTSMAAPHVSGLAAILRGIPGNDLTKVRKEIETTALDLGTPGWDMYTGYGLIQMDSAIQPVWPTPTPIFTPGFTQTFPPTFTPTATLPVNSPSPAPAIAPVLPATGFTPNRTTILPSQPTGMTYADLGDLWLEIPRLGVDLSIVGVPQTANGWDVSWLGDQAGWLNGTAFPTQAGNSVLAAHVYDASGKPGPFVNLNSLQWGDQIIIHAFGQEYVYAVRESELVAPEAVSSMIKHEEYPWLTLITCQGYDEASNSYRTRVVVRAVQVAIK